MLNRIAIVLVLLFATASLNAQCTAGFTPASFGDSLVFTNTSTLANAHYYWSFGDGDGSNNQDPYHIYPDDGKYEVTLFARDTVSGCVDYFSAIVQVSKPDTFQCVLDGEVIITDVNNTIFYSTANNTTGCPQFTNFDCDAGNAIDQAWSIIYDTTLGGSYWISRIQALDTAGGNYTVFEEFYITKPVLYTDDDNYGACSGNFEVVIDYQPQNLGAEVHFTAMNDSATSYNWTLYGLGNPINMTGQSISQFYNFTLYERAWPYMVKLEIDNSTNGCSDTITRQFFVRNLDYMPFVDREDPIRTLEVLLYPNPASEEAYVEIPGNWNGGISGNPIEMRILDLNGRIIKSETLYDESRIYLDIRTWPNGLYLIEVRQGDQREVKKLLKRSLQTN